MEKIEPKYAKILYSSVNLMKGMNKLTYEVTEDGKRICNITYNEEMKKTNINLEEEAPDKMFILRKMRGKTLEIHLLNNLDPVIEKEILDFV